MATELNNRQDAVEEAIKQFEIFLGAQKNDDPEATRDAGHRVILLVGGIVKEVAQTNKKIIMAH